MEQRKLVLVPIRDAPLRRTVYLVRNPLRMVTRAALEVERLRCGTRGTEIKHVGYDPGPAMRRRKPWVGRSPKALEENLVGTTTARNVWPIRMSRWTSSARYAGVEHASPVKPWETASEQH